MTKDGILDLLTTICIHYPSYKKNFETAEGKIIQRVIDEWYRQIGYLDHAEAVSRFDEYLRLPEGNKFAPDVKWFLGYKPKPKEEEHHSSANFTKIDRLGRLTDEEGRLYAFVSCPDERYHYDNMGRIADSKGRIVG